MGAAPLHLAAVVEAFGPELRAQSGPLPSHQHRALESIRSCRTAALGGQRWDCPHCGHHHYVYHSCRNRHCPRCQKQRQQQWLQARLQELPAVPYHHLVFTIPHELAEHCRTDPDRLYRSLFAAASQTLDGFARTRGVRLGMLAVLHTWGRNLHYHPHLHVVVTCGGLRLSDQRWQPFSQRFLFPAANLSRVFRGKMFAAMERFEVALPDQRLPDKWHVHVEAPRTDPRSLLLYLGRYICRVALDERQLVGLDLEAGTVTFRYSDTAEGGKTRRMTLPGVAFLRRFLDHVLPKGFVKVRHYGLFAHGIKKQALAKVEQALREHGPRFRRTLWCLQALLATIRPAPPIPKCPQCRQTLLPGPALAPARPNRPP